MLSDYERDYPYGWLGILADVAPSSDELVYAHHERGFALLSLRSPELSRLYLQCRPTRTSPRGRTTASGGSCRPGSASTAGRSHEGPMLEKGVTRDAQLRRRSRCSTGGCSSRAMPAHIVPPTGAKGLNLAIADVRVLAEALARCATMRDGRPLDALLRDRACGACGGPSTSPGG